MFRSAFMIALTWTTLLPLAAAVAQEEFEAPATFGQRVDRFRKNLFGGEKDETLVAKPGSQNARMGTRPQAPARRGSMNGGSQMAEGAPRPERNSSMGNQNASNATRSSRRTFQPDYQPPQRTAVEETAANEMADPVPPSVPPETPESRPAKRSAAQMPSGFAGPQRSVTPAKEAAAEAIEPFEPTMADSTVEAPAAKREPVESVARKTTPSRPVAKTPARSAASDETVANSDEESGKSASEAKSLAAAQGSGNVKASATKPAPRTLEERLAAARSQQAPKTIHPATDTKRTAARPQPAATSSEPLTVTPSKMAGATEKVAASKTVSPQDVTPDMDVGAEPPAAPLVAATPDPVGPTKEVSRPVERVARAGSKPTTVASAAKATESKALEPKATEPRFEEPLASSQPDESVLFKQQSPVLSVETAGPRKIKIGTPAPFSVTMQNTGTVAAHDVVVSVRLPEWAEVVAADPRVGSARTIVVDGGSGLQWTIPTLEAKSRAELGLSIVPRKSRPFDLAVSFTRTPDVSQASVEVQEPKLLMNLAGPDEVYFGEREVYKLTLSNPGTGEAENVVVRLLPTTAGEEQAVSHPIGNIAAGESKVVELELTARQSHTLEIKAEAVADGGLQANIDEAIIVRRPELAVAVQGPKLQYAGTPATYKVHVTNPGNATAKNVQVSALIPRGATFLSSSEGGAVDGDQRKVTWTLGNLRAGADSTLAFKCLLNAPGGNTAQVACHAEGDIRHQSAATTEVEALADLTLKVVDPQGPVPVGQEVTYEVHVHNRGTKGAEKVEIMAFFSPGVEPIAVDQGRHEIGAGQIAFEPVAVIEAGQELVYLIRARADRGGNHVFRAEIACPTLETKLSADETTRFYVDDSLDPNEAAAEAVPATETSAPEAPAEIQSIDLAAEVEVEGEADFDGSEEPQPE